MKTYLVKFMLKGRQMQDSFVANSPNQAAIFCKERIQVAQELVFIIHNIQHFNIELTS